MQTLGRRLAHFVQQNIERRQTAYDHTLSQSFINLSHKLAKEASDGCTGTNVNIGRMWLPSTLEKLVWQEYKPQFLKDMKKRILEEDIKITEEDSRSLSLEWTDSRQGFGLNLYNLRQAHIKEHTSALVFRAETVYAEMLVLLEQHVKQSSSHTLTIPLADHWVGKEPTPSYSRNRLEILNILKKMAAKDEIGVVMSDPSEIILSVPQ